MSRVNLDAGLLRLVMNCLERDAAEGKVSRKEILEEIQKDVKPCEEVKCHNSNTPFEN